MVTYTESNCPSHYDVSNRPTLTLISRDSRSQDTANTIYFITPTFRRATQKPDFVRLAQTLMQVSGATKLDNHAANQVYSL